MQLKLAFVTIWTRLMTSEFLYHIFSSLQSLEKKFATVKELLPGPSESPDVFHHHLPQQKKILRQMRRTANKLQLEAAHSDWVSLTRSLKIFYGLNQLIREDIILACSNLSKARHPKGIKTATRDKAVVYH